MAASTINIECKRFGCIKNLLACYANCRYTGRCDELRNELADKTAAAEDDINRYLSERGRHPILVQILKRGVKFADRAERSSRKPVKPVKAVNAPVVAAKSSSPVKSPKPISSRPAASPTRLKSKPGKPLVRTARARQAPAIHLAPVIKRRSVIRPAVLATPRPTQDQTAALSVSAAAPLAGGP